MQKVIKNDADYRNAMARLEELLIGDSKIGTPDGDELELLSLLIENYESQAYPTVLPNPIEAIKFRMEQQNLKQKDLAPMIGSRSKVSEVLAGKRTLTLSMIRSLNKHLGIPASVLLQEKDQAILEEQDVDWSAFPIKEIIKRGWVENRWGKKTAEHAEEIVRAFIKPLGSPNVAFDLFRKNDHVRSKGRMDEIALDAWTARVAIKARELKLKTRYVPETVNLEFMQKLARLSWSDTGPLLAQEFLAKHGIPLVIEPHLPKTHLDGAAILVESDRPIIGMTIRYDRIDNFWFCLMHELAHISLHMGTDVKGFYDDLESDDLGDQREAEADKLASDALIPEAVWVKSPASNSRIAFAAEHLAEQLGIHPAIVAGRMRRKNNNYKILNQLVGHREIKKHFKDVEWSK